MPSKTTNLGLNLFLENDYVDFDQINENFETIDKLVSCVESGSQTATYGGASSGSFSFRYKKYSDNTIELDGRIDFTSLRCNDGLKSPYNSGNVNVYIPFNLSEITTVKMDMASQSFNMIQNITSNAATDAITFRLKSLDYEDSDNSKRIYISIKGVLRNG